MAQRRAFTEGFDLYPGSGTTGYGLYSTWPNSAGAFGLTTGRFGGLAITRSGSSNNNYCARTIPVTTQIVLGFALWWPDGLSNYRIITLQSPAGNDHGYIYAQGGRLAYVVGSTIVCISDDVLLTNNAWTYIELCLNLSDTEGSIEFYVNDFLVPEMSVSGIDTKGHSDAGIGRIELYIQGNGNRRWDDMYCEIDGLTRIGEGRIFPLKPTSDIQDEFVPSTSVENYQSVNQVPANATLFNSSGVVGEQDLFTVEGMSFAPEKIYGVQLTTLAGKDEAAARAIRNVLKSGAVVSEGEDFVLAFESSVFNRTFYPVNPDTLAPWLKAGVENAQIGYKVSI